MQNHLNENVLITCNAWFVAPDGSEYKAVWGKLKAIHEAGKTLGFIPNRSHANWFVEIGEMIIMGCQIMYLMRCDEKPNQGNAKAWSSTPDKGAFEYERPNIIYISE